eukprot:m.143245 g.143245  ORF g.143245 m.143245 type:complete len:288 (-) comp30305_c0_seq1:202-1065(-)
MTETQNSNSKRRLSETLSDVHDPTVTDGVDVDVDSSTQVDEVRAFFDGLKLNRVALEALSGEKLKTRAQCPMCKSSRMYYCYDCHVLVNLQLGQDIPSVNLPIKVDVIKHANERNSKSTAVHAKLVAPTHVTIHTFPEIPEFEDRDSTVLLYPCEEAVDLSEVEYRSIKRVVFVDSTWSQCGDIVSDSRLSGLRRVKISSVTTKFWRPQYKKPDTYLATIEAIYHVFKEYARAFECPEYDGRYDGLLFMFTHTFNLIQKRYRAQPEKRRRTAKKYESKLATNAPQLM